MNLDIKHEYLPNPPALYETPHNTGSIPPRLYPQDRDWTCAMACLRSIASGLADLGCDDRLIETYHIEPGPHYSREIKALGILESHGLEAMYGCDFKPDEKDLSFLWNLMSQGCRVMTNWLMSYDHWTVLLSCIKSAHGPDYDLLGYYDPYCDEVLTIRRAHFDVMWLNPDGLQKDFIAVKP